MEMMEAHVGNRVRQRRETLKLSRHDLSVIMRVEPAKIALWEGGLDRIPAAHLVSIAEALNAPISYFFDGVPKRDSGNDWQPAASRPT